MTSTTWTIPEHTRAKHLLLQGYLKAWYPILGQSHRRVIFLDGFAGPGVYENGEWGSPLIAIDTLVRHSYFPQLSSTEFVFIFVEAEESRCHNLKDEIDRYWESNEGKPHNVVVKTIHGAFAEVASRIAEIGPGRLAPTLAFVDPFGWSGVPISIIADLLASDKCEVIFNFMFDHVNRFVNDQRPGIAHSFEELFGTTNSEHRDVNNISGEERKAFLRDLYASQLRDIANFTYVRPFEVLNVDRRRTEYYLMFGTRDVKGLTAMKDAMWDIDPINGVRFSGFAGNQPMLFEPSVDLVALRRALLDKFGSHTASVEEINEFVVVHTDYKESHYRQVLRSLEEESLIRCLSSRKKARTYPTGTLLEFLKAPERPQLFA